MDWGASAAQTDADPPSLIGTLVAGKYRVDKLLGSGSTGDVYLSTHIGLEKVVALKVLHADMVKHENFVERFKREARAASKLEHPNSVRVLDFGEDPNGVLYIAMEYIDGRDLWSLLDEEWPLDNQRIVDIMSQVLAALGKAHSLGIVHRDLKPENIMVRRSTTEDGEKDVVTVCDFGIAQLSPIQLSGSLSQHVPTVTGEGMVVGTPAYMSPEQARAEPLDARSDVYSAGVVLFQMLTRQLPFTAETPLAVAVMHCSSPPPTPSQLALVHPALESVCLRALCKAKEARYQSARDMQLALQDAVAATNAQLALPGRKRRPYPLAAPPITAPPVARQQSPASLAPFELHSEPEPSQPAKSGTKNAAFALLFVLATAGLTAITLFGAGQHESGATAPKSTHASTVPQDARGDVRDDEMTARDVAAAPAPLPSAPEVESASSAFARVEQAASASVAAAAASATAPSQPPAAAARPARAERERDVRDRAEREPREANEADKQARRPAAVQPSAGHRPQQLLAAEDFETDEVEPRLSVTPLAAASGEGGRTRAAVAEQSPKQPAASASVETPAVDIAKSVEPEIPVGLVELPSRGKVVVTPDPARPAVIPAAGSPDRAQVHLGSIVTQSAVSKASIRGALNDAALRRCYQDALRLGAAGGAPMTAQLELATGMNGRVASANVSGGLPKQLATCVEQVAKSGRVREVDTGIAKATITLEFQP
jgi:eukaryotic-like serine/threonine-protein kinase